MQPCAVLHLLNYLIDEDHEVFRGKSSVVLLKQRMREAVERQYPETEGNKPEEARDGTIPKSIQDVLEEIEEEQRSKPMSRERLLPEKNATPGTAQDQ